MLYTPKWATDEINEILFKFLWSKKKPHVKKETIIADIDSGGLKMVHFESMQKAIKLNWVKRLINMSSNCAVLANYQINFPIPIKEVFRSRLSKEFIMCKCPFYQQQLEYWFELCTNKPESPKDIFEEPLWFNKHILVGGYPVFYKRWWDNNIRSISDICRLDGTIMTRAELQRTWNISVDQMEYNSIVAAIPNGWRRTIKNQPVSCSDDEIYVHLTGGKKKISNVKCRDIYKIIIPQIQKPPTAVNNWTETYNIGETEWENIFRRPLRI